MNKTENRPLTVLVSGAGGGLGIAVVRSFNDLGYRVIAIDIDPKRLEQLHGYKNVITRVLDITKPGAILAFAGETDIWEQGLDILVSLAARYDTFPLTEADPSGFHRLLEVNFLGSVNMIQGFLPHLIRNKGRVMVVSSESYKIQALFQPYMVTKAALEAYCRAARQELALKQVKLIVIRPGAIRTPLLQWMNDSVGPEKYLIFGKEFYKSLERSKKMVGGIAEPETVAAAILRIARLRRPGWVYCINNSFLLRIMAIMPGPWLDRMIIRYFRKGS